MRYTLLFALLIVPMLIGCGPRTVTVSGKVTFMGEPAKDISVVFEPISQAAIAQPLASGMTDAEGNYSLELAGSKKKNGAMPGEYAVFFTWIDPNADPSPESAGYKENPCPYKIPDKARLGYVRFTVPDRGPCTADFAFTEEDLQEKIKEGI